jgi:hypothetical protein
VFTRSRIVECLRGAPAPGIRRGDQDLNPDMEPKRPLTRAAVLVPLVDRRDGLTVLLTKRADHLHDHAGQVSFPGGRIDDATRTPWPRVTRGGRGYRPAADR